MFIAETPFRKKWMPRMPKSTQKTHWKWTGSWMMYLYSWWISLLGVPIGNPGCLGWSPRRPTQHVQEISVCWRNCRLSLHRLSTNMTTKQLEDSFRRRGVSRGWTPGTLKGVDHGFLKGALDGSTWLLTTAWLREPGDSHRLTADSGTNNNADTDVFVLVEIRFILLCQHHQSCIAVGSMSGSGLLCKCGWLGLVGCLLTVCRWESVGWKTPFSVGLTAVQR